MTAHDLNLASPASGQLAQLDDLQACVVIYLRLWCEGPAGRHAVQNDLVSGLGLARAGMALDACRTMFGVLSEHRRRPLQRYAIDCPSLAPDEACFANFVARAATEDREDALWIAMMLVRADMAPHLTAAAGAFGLRIKQMLLQSAPSILSDRPALLH